MLEVHGPQRALEVASQPVVEAQRVEVGRRADLEHDVARPARVRRACRDRVEPMLLGVVQLEVASRVERPALECRARVAFEGVHVGVLAQAEEDLRAGVVCRT